jgi:uncharacterized protein YqgV (UPF0045/DUF77 family)
MSNIVAEFTIEPFEPATPGPHVQAAIDAAKTAAATSGDVVVEVGPFGTSIEGPADTVLAIAASVNDAAISNGATRVSMQLTVRQPSE